MVDIETAVLGAVLHQLRVQYSDLLSHYVIKARGKKTGRFEMFVLIPVLLTAPFLLLRFLIHIIRDAIWRLNGTTAAILEIERSEVYEDSVQELSVWGRHKLDPLVCANFLSDFILFHEGFQPPEYVLRDDVTLYCITPRQFVFVQSAEADDVLDVGQHPFMRVAQHRLAKRVLVMPAHAAYRLVEQLRGRPGRGKLIFISNTGRCGSTLMCELFHSTGRCMAYSEPSVLNELLRFKDSNMADIRFVEATVALLCKPRQGTLLHDHAVKMAVTSIELLPLLSKVFPDAVFLFLYRDFTATVSSYRKVVTKLPYNVATAIMAVISRRLLVCFGRRHGTHTARFSCVRPVAKPRRLYGVLSMLPLYCIQCYRRWYRDLNVGALRYEDFLEDPTHAVAKLFDYCGLPQSLVQRALQNQARDSQNNSVLNRESLGRVKVTSMSTDDRAEVESICSKMDLPSVYEEPILPNTITNI